MGKITQFRKFYHLQYFIYLFAFMAIVESIHLTTISTLSEIKLILTLSPKNNKNKSRALFKKKKEKSSLKINSQFLNGTVVLKFLQIINMQNQSWRNIVRDTGKVLGLNVYGITGLILFLIVYIIEYIIQIKCIKNITTSTFNGHNYF